MPGLPALAVEHPALPAQSPVASIVDNLARDTEAQKRAQLRLLAPAGHGTLNTQAPGSDGTQNVIQVGTQRFVLPRPTNSRGGFEVLSVDTRNLTGQVSWFELGTPDAGPAAAGDARHAQPDRATASAPRSARASS